MAIRTATATTTTTPVVAALGNKKSTAESSAAAKLDVCFATMGSSVLYNIYFCCRVYMGGHVKKAASKGLCFFRKTRFFFQYKHLTRRGRLDS